jgi:hypothetical protein
MVEGPASMAGRLSRKGSCPTSNLAQLVRLRAKERSLSTGRSVGDGGVELARPVTVIVKSTAEEEELWVE